MGVTNHLLTTYIHWELILQVGVEIPAETAKFNSSHIIIFARSVTWSSSVSLAWAGEKKYQTVR